MDYPEMLDVLEEDVIVILERLLQDYAQTGESTRRAIESSRALLAQVRLAHPTL